MGLNSGFFPRLLVRSYPRLSPFHSQKKKKNDAVNKEKPADLVINLSAGSLVQLFTWEIESSKLLHLFFTLAGGPT